MCVHIPKYMFNRIFFLHEISSMRNTTVLYCSATAVISNLLAPNLLKLKKKNNNNNKVKKKKKNTPHDPSCSARTSYIPVGVTLIKVPTFNLLGSHKGLVN